MGIILELIGWSGTAAFVVAYYLVSSGKLKPDGALYQCLNLYGAIAVGASALPRQAWPAIGLEVIWGGIALAALFRIGRNSAGAR